MMHYPTTRLKRIARLQYGDALGAEVRRDGEVSVVGSNGEVGKHDVANTGGPVVIIGRKGSFGKVNYSYRPSYCIDTAYFVDERHTKADLRWLYWALQTLDLDSISVDTGVPGLSRDIVHNAPVPTPVRNEQRAIADFLDRETAMVDDLIARKQQLLELLRSRQDAVVRQLVVGQDLDVPKRRSGYSWLGDVPAHWKALALKRIAKRVVVGIAEASTHAYADSGVPLVRTTNVKANKIDTSDLLYINKEFADKNRSKYMRCGDIVTARTGNPGISGVIPAELDGSQSFTMLITTLREDHVPEFFCYYINSEPARTYFALEGWGTAQINISVPILQMLPTPCPPEKEQRQIAETIKRFMEASEGQLNLINEAIERLREYRSSLISAAVTGQIDVRHYRPQEAAALCQ